MPEGFVQTFPIQSFHQVSLDAGVILTGIDFGNRPEGGDVHGTKWNDLNGNGVRDDDAAGVPEPGLGGVVIYSDANGNGKFDQGEISTTTMFDDSTTPNVE